MKKENEIIKLTDLELPKKVLAVSYMVNDKFTYKTTESNEDVYEYLGIRRTTNAAWTNSITRRISDAFIALSLKQGFNYKVNEILTFMKFNPKISLIFEPKGKTLFKRNITMKTLKTKINKLLVIEEYRSYTVKRYSEENLQRLVEFINSESKSREFIEFKGKKSLIYTLDFGKQFDPTYLPSDSKLLQMLIDLEILTTPRLMLYKDEEFDFEDASSGEKHLLFTMLNLASRIMPNSLILIDEPELSLHPNWQMKYINTLKNIFYDYETCHFILATHSHYIVSDLEEQSSTLIVMNKEDDSSQRKSRLIEYSTFAWSAENILYNIFEVRTSRNFYFEMDLRNLISLVREKSNDVATISGLITKLKNYIFDTNDPINLIISEAERYLENAKEN